MFFRGVPVKKTPCSLTSNYLSNVRGIKCSTTDKVPKSTGGEIQNFFITNAKIEGKRLPRLVYLVANIRNYYKEMSLLIEISASDTPPCQLWQPCVSGCSVRRSRNLCFPRHHQHHVTQPLHHHHHGAGPLHKLDTPSASKAIFIRVQLPSCE